MSSMRLRIVAGPAFLTATFVVIAGTFWDTAATVAKPPDAVVLPPAAQQIVHKGFEAANAIQDPERKSMELMGLAWGQFRRGEVNSARKTLQKAREAAEAIPPTSAPIVPHPIVMVGESQSEMGDTEAAHATFAQAVKVLEARGDRERFDDWSNFAQMQLKAEGRMRSRDTLAAFRKYLTRKSARDPDSTSFDKHEALALVPHLEGFAQAMKTVHESLEFNPDDRETLLTERSSALLAIVSALGDGDQDIAEPILHEARQAIEADPHRIWSQNLEDIAKARVRMRQFREALAAALEMSNDPDDTHRKAANNAFSRTTRSLFRQAIALVNIAEAQLKSKDRAGALETADIALGVVEKIGDPGHKPRPLSDAADFFTNAREFDRALRTARKIEDLGWRLGNLRSVARGQASAGDEAGARATLRESLAIALELGWTEMVAEIQAKLGDVKAALKTVETLPGQDARETALGSVASVCASIGDAETALRLIGNITKPEGRSQAWIDAASSLKTPGAKPNR